jgi:hypothetical protein
MRRPDRTTQAIDLHLPKALLITSFASSNADETLVARMFKATQSISGSVGFVRQIAACQSAGLFVTRIS